MSVFVSGFFIFILWNSIFEKWPLVWPFKSNPNSAY